MPGPKITHNKKLNSVESHNSAGKVKKIRRNCIENIELEYIDEFIGSRKMAKKLASSRQLLKKEVTDNIDDTEQKFYEMKQEIKEREFGVNEGFVSIPNETLRSLPHFAKNKDFD